MEEGGMDIQTPFQYTLPTLQVGGIIKQDIWYVYLKVAIHLDA